MFGEAIFHGKAIYDVHTFRGILADRFPAETLLSHDLIEGAHAGVGLATDIELFENLPLDYASYSQRQHRWIRGDWQIAPWIFRQVPASSGGSAANPLTVIGRWRIFDNLRRSLVPVASLLLLLFGWLISRGAGRLELWWLGSRSRFRRSRRCSTGSRGTCKAPCAVGTAPPTNWSGLR